MEIKMTYKEIIESRGIKQRWVAEKLGTTEAVISVLLNNEHVFRALEAYMEEK